MPKYTIQASRMQTVELEIEADNRSHANHQAAEIFETADGHPSRELDWHLDSDDPRPISWSVYGLNLDEMEEELEEMRTIAVHLRFWDSEMNRELRRVQNAGSRTNRAWYLEYTATTWGDFVVGLVQQELLTEERALLQLAKAAKCLEAAYEALGMDMFYPEYATHEKRLEAGAQWMSERLAPLKKAEVSA